MRYVTTPYYCIDSGCSQAAEVMGYLTALNLDNGQATFVRCRV